MRKPPLSGVVVLDLGQIYNGPYATFLMAMAGATVIKIEPPAGEYLRARAHIGGAGMAFAMLNSNKHSVVIDLKTPSGVDQLKRAVRRADVLLENFAQGTMERLGLSWPVLREINPRLIYASGSGYGRNGPYRDYPAMDVTVQAMAGLMSVTGFPDGPPAKCGPAVCDFMGGVHLYAATVTALYEREKTGKGGLVEVSMQEAVYPTLTSSIGLWHKTGRSERTGNRHSGLATSPYGVFPAADGHVAITCVNDKHWRALATLMGTPELADDERYMTPAARVANLPQVEAIVSAWTSRLPREEIFQRLIAIKVPAAPVRDVAEITADPHMHARGALQTIDHPMLGRVSVPASPLRFEGLEPVAVAPSPALDDYAEAFRRELLGEDPAGKA